MAGRRSPHPTLALLGGASAVSWPVFWITLTVAYFALLAGSPDLAAVNPLIRLLTVLAGEAALFAVLGVGRPAWVRCGARLRPWMALLAFALASAASAVAQGYADVALGLVDDPGILSRIPIFVALMTTTLCLAVITTELRREHQRRLRALEQGNDELRRLRSTLLAEADAARADSLRLLTADVMRALGRGSADDPKAVSDGLRGLADDVIRPLSHMLMDSQPDVSVNESAEHRPRRRSDLTTWAREVTAPPLLRTRALAAIMSLLSFCYGWATFGLVRGAVLSIATLVTITVLCWLLNRCYGGLAPTLSLAGRCSVSVAVLVVLSALTAVSWTVVSRAWPYSQTIAMAAPIPAVIAVLLASAHAAEGRRGQLESAQTALNNDLRWQVAHTRESLRYQDRTLARGLHGPAYAAVMAAGLKYRDAAQRGEPITEAAAAEMREQILSAWPDAHRDEQAGRGRDTEEALAQLVGMWSGVCDISVAITDDARCGLQADPACASAFISVVTEACSNAVRHGGAHRIRIDASLKQPNVLAVTAADDGTPGDDLGRSGLGSRLLESVTLQWSLKREGPTTVLALELPVEPLGDGG